MRLHSAGLPLLVILGLLAAPLAAEALPAGKVPRIGYLGNGNPTTSALGCFIAGGCNVAGLSISPAIGEALAAWIVEGEPPLDLAPLSIARFGDGRSSQGPR